MKFFKINVRLLFNTLYVKLHVCTNLACKSTVFFSLKRLINPSQDAQRRKENCLNIWIQEAKGLTIKNRYYCTILVNGTICARTTIKQMTDMLFWGEEFDLSGLTNCSDLSIEIWRACDTKASSPTHRHRTTSPHRISSNHRQQTNTSPLPMRKAMMACTKATDDGSVSPPDFTTFRNSIILDDLSIANTITDEEASRQKRRKFKSSKIVKPTLIATVHISLLDLSNSGEVESWYTPNLSDESKLSTGQLKQPDGKVSGESNVNKTKSKGRRSSRRDINVNSVQIRVKIRYRTVTVLPLTSYARLESNLCQFQLPKAASFFTDIDKLHDVTLGANSLSLLCSSNKPDLIHLLSSLDPWLNVKAKAELAGAIVVLQQARGQVTEFLASLILCEVKKQSDPNMVLRANSIATKATEIYLRLVGGSYLSNILSEFVQVVISGRTVDSQLKTSNRYPIDYEVDIAKVQTSTQLAQNQVNLLSLVESVWKRILLSEVEFPEQFRALFVEIRQYLDSSKSNCPSVNNVHNNHSDGFNSLSSSSSPTTVNGTLCEHVISACLFLRYICPAILSPSLFNLTHEFPSEPRVLRAFTLVAKTIQTLANFSLFSGSKEAYMKFMNQFVTDQLPAMRQFLQSISTPCTKPTSLQKLSKSSTVLKPINSLSNIYNNTVNNNSTNGSMPHSLHIVGSDENCIKSSFSVSKGKIRDSSTGNNHFLNNSQSHHGGFICDTDCQDILIHSRKSPASEINKVNDTKSNVNSSFKQQKYQDTTPVSNSISLPPLPTNQHAHLGIRDHVDLPLCLALCHLQLSEAIQKVPEDKRIPEVNELKLILNEVDMFLASGKDPQPNWWNDKINMNDHHHHNNNNNKQNSTTLIKNNTSTVINEEMHRNYSKPSHVHLLNNQSNCSVNKSNDAYIYEYTYNSNKSKLMNASSSNKSINVADGGTISLKSPSNLSVTSLISPKQAAFPEKNYHRSNNYAEQSTITSDSNMEFEVSKGKQYSSIMQESAIRYNSLENIKTSHSNDVNVNSEQIFKAVNKSIPSHSTTLNNHNESKKFIESNHDFASVTRRDNRRRVQYPRKTQEPTIICENSVDNTSKNVCVNSSSVIDQLSHHHSSSIDICDDVNPEHTEHSEIVPVYFGNSSSSGYHTMSSHGNILNDLPTVEQKSSIIEPIISTPDDVIMTSLSTTPMDVSSMNNPLYPYHSVDSYSNSNNIQDQVITLSNADHSFSICNPPKKSMQNPNRRHTYVNLSNSHETDHLIDALIKDNSTNSTVNNNVNHVELDRRNRAPPLYMSNEQKNRRLTLTHPKCHEYANSPTGLNNYSTTRNYVEHNDFNYYGMENINYPVSFKLSPSEQELYRNSTLQAEIQRMKFIPTNTPHTIGPTSNKRTGLFSSENYTSTSVINLQSELDASQARLAEAQARLLANEAERVQILKLWQSELIKQTQLINASKTVHNNTTSSNLQYTSNLQLTSKQNDDLQNNPDENDNFDENEPRSMSVIPLLTLNGLKSQDYSESIYDYEDSELMHHNNDDQNKQSLTDTNIKLNASNGINRNFGLHPLQPGSHMKSLRLVRGSHSNQPRMGASAVVTNLHDYHGTGINNYLQSTIPRSRMMSNRSYKSHNTATSISSTTRAELDDFCRISRSPSTPGLSNINYTHTIFVDPDNMGKLNTTDNPDDLPPPTDEEFAKQIQAIVNENNQHLHSE
ncbi:Disabled like-interacting protein [Schistosoma japonicum]|nr:Disabled like-interacting protein [Schistosoma japonicum]